jgi:hypothetical protein
MSPPFPLIVCLSSLALSHAEPSCSIDSSPQLQPIAPKTKGGGKSMLQVAAQDVDRYRGQSDCACDPLANLLKHNASLLTREQRTSPGSFGCPNSNAMQVMNQNGQYFGKSLNLQSGSYNTLFSRSFSDTPSITNINGAALSHVDSYGYAVVRVPDSSFVFVRFDSTGKLEFLKKMPGDAWMSGAINSAGDYLAWCNQPIGGEGFIKISNPSQIQQSMTNDPDQLPGIPSTDIIKVPGHKLADIVVFDADVGEGQHSYLLGIKNNAASIVVYNLDTSVMSEVTPSNLPVDSLGWGSGWNFQNSIFFAANEGSGVYEIQIGTLDLVLKTVSTRKVGMSEATESNDGFNCLTGSSPFPNPDPKPPYPGCERFCMDNGCPCLKPYAERCLVESCNQCPFCV